jgi:hypothetical protein
MPKSSKRLLISDGSINQHGFSVDMDSLDLTLFNNNPIMLWMHKRPLQLGDPLPIGHWEDLEMKDGRLTGVPVFDEDEFALSIYRKVESGTLRMCSSGIVPGQFVTKTVAELRTGRNPSTGATIKFSRLALADTDEIPVLENGLLREASIVDIGSNINSCVLYDSNDQVIELTDINQVINLFTPQNSKPHSITMELKSLAEALHLSADAALPAILQAVKQIVAELAVQKDLVTAKDNEIARLKSEAVSKEINLFLDTAVADGRIVEKEKASFVKLAAADFDAVKEAINARTPRTSVAERFQQGTPSKERRAELAAKSWDELDKGNLLAEVKLSFPDLYEEKFEKEFGKKPSK